VRRGQTNQRDRDGDPGPRRVGHRRQALYADIRLIFEGRGRPDFREPPTLAHGRIEQRAIWTPTERNDSRDFPDVGQAFAIERHTLEKKTGKTATETVYRVTSHTGDTANAARVLALNRGHWTVENGCHYTLDWNWVEDRCTIRTGHGPEKVTALRRFAFDAIKAKSRDTVAATIQPLARNLRLVFDYLRMTDNSRRRTRLLPAPAGENGSAVRGQLNGAPTPFVTPLPLLPGGGNRLAVDGAHRPPGKPLGLPADRHTGGLPPGREGAPRPDPVQPQPRQAAADAR
jgi:predicted transposase YbfD/YdcC